MHPNEQLAHPSRIIVTYMYYEIPHAQGERREHLLISRWPTFAANKLDSSACALCRSRAQEAEPSM